jgi:hypothetical protein
MNRLQIFVLNHLSEGDGIFTTYIDTPNVISFLNRVGRVNRFSILAVKGKRSLYIERLDPATLIKTLTEFQNQP